MHRFASFTFANDSNSLISSNEDTPPMFRSVTKSTSKKLDFDMEDDDLSLSNSSPVIMKESLTNLFIKKESRKSAVSLQGNFPRLTSTLLNLEDDSEPHNEQRKSETAVHSLLLPRFGSSGDIQMDNKDAEIHNSPTNKAKNQSLFSQSPQNSQQKTSTENQDPRAEKSTSNSHSLVDDSLAKDFAIKLSLTLNKNSRDPDLNTISPQTTAKLIHESSSSDYLIIDCRYDYEFQGGHIKDAINILCPKVLEQIFITNKQLLYNPIYIQDLKKDLARTLANTESYMNASDDILNKDLPLIIFHCEFSQKRGPRAFRNLRSKDRAANIANFPHLDYPEIYVLEGGYCNFYPQFPELCEGGYLTMIDEDFSMEFAKSKQFEKECWNKKSNTELNLLD